MMKILGQNRTIMERLNFIETSLAKSKKCGKETVEVPLEVRVSYFYLLNHVVTEKRIHATLLIASLTFIRSMFWVNLIIFTLQHHVKVGYKEACR